MIRHHSAILISFILGFCLAVSSCDAKDNVTILIERAKQYEKESDYASAVKCWHDIFNSEGQQHKALAQYHVAKCHYKLGDMTRAIEEFEDFVEKYPDDNRACFARKYLIIIYGLEKDYDQVIKHCEIIINNCKNDELGCWARRELGVTYYFLKEFDKSREQLQKVLDKCDREFDLTTSLLYLARADQAEDKYFESLEYLYEVLVNYHDSKYVGDCKYHVGIAWSRLGKIEKAIPLLETTINKYPSSIEYENGFSELMFLYEVKEQHEKIIEQCEKYVEDNNHSYIPKYLFFLVKNYKRIGNNAKAREAYNRLLNNYHDSNYVHLAQKEIGEMHPEER